MKNKPKTFVVPHDFTNVSDIALEYAIATAKPLNAQISIIHVVSKSKDIPEAEGKLEKIAETFSDRGVKITPYVRVGSIFNDIGDFAAEQHAELIFMGTHGRHGWQHITGMNALKVINNSTVPFIIVQESTPKETGYDDIVVPLDLNKETKQKLAIVSHLANYFNSKVHILIPEEKDEFLLHKVKANKEFAKKYLGERGVSMYITTVPSGDFDHEIVKYAVSIDADLIAIMNLNKIRLFGGILGGNKEEYIITNEAKIPVMIMNPIEGISLLSVDFNG